MTVIITEGQTSLFRKSDMECCKWLWPGIIWLFSDHNLGGQPGQLATGKLQGVYKQRTTYGREAFSALGLYCSRM